MLAFFILLQFAFSQSLEDKVGQLFIIGISGKSLNKNNISQLEKIKPGGIILFKHNIETAFQTYRFNTSLQSWAESKALFPLLIGTDQEGGVVNRIRTYPKSPSAAVLGKQTNLAHVESYGSVLGRLMHLYGFNLNFAPVLDQTTSDYADFIGTRAFSPDLSRIISSSSAFAKGLKGQGILTVGKHFPGHGRVNIDSHLALPEVHLSKEEIASTSAKPFLELYKKDLLDAVMIGHLSFPKLDNRKIPATFSKPVLDGFLRNDLSYQGLIITDDIEMKAAGISEDPGERAILAIEAGVDMIMIAWNANSQVRAHQAVVNAVRSGRLSLERIHESLNRIQTAKTYLKKSPKPVSQKEFFALINQIPWAKTVEKVNSPPINLNLLRTKISQSDEDSVLVMSPDTQFLDSFAGAKKILITASTKVDALEAAIQSDGLMVFHATSPKLVSMVKNLSPKLRSQVIVINSSRPALQEAGFLFVANFLERSRIAEQKIRHEVIKTRLPSSSDLNTK